VSSETRTTHDRTVVDFPKTEIASEKKARRVMTEATRLASLAPGEWKLWIDRSAEQLGVLRATLQEIVEALIKDKEQKARRAQVEMVRRRVPRKHNVRRSARENANSVASKTTQNARAKKNTKRSAF
jgi:hypothetical protein